MPAGKIVRFTVYTCSFGTGWVTFGYVFCHTSRGAKKRAREECRSVMRETMFPLFGGLKKAEKAIRVDEPELVRSPDVGLPEEERQQLMAGRDVVIFLDWLRDVIEPLKQATAPEPNPGMAYVYKK